MNLNYNVIKYNRAELPYRAKNKIEVKYYKYNNLSKGSEIKRVKETE